MENNQPQVVKWPGLGFPLKTFNKFRWFVLGPMNPEQAVNDGKFKEE